MKAKRFTRETIGEIGMYDRNFPEFGVGDTVAVSLRIKEGGKERLQVFEGDVIAMHAQDASSTFTVRKIASNAISVERVFPYYSPLIDSVKFIRQGKVRRAKLYFMRDRIGKAARVREKVLTKEQKEILRQKKVGAVANESAKASFSTKSEPVQSKPQRVQEADITEDKPKADEPTEQSE